MSAERGGLLKSRAEAFARHLGKRLQSLRGAEDGGGGWSEVTLGDSEVYYDIDSSMDSPQEELPEPIFIAAQNRDNLPLQRSESSGSEYFDTIEELPQSPAPSTSVPFLKKIPILHLKTEKPASLTNGHTNIIDADLGCSRVLEMPCEEVQPCVSESSNKPVEGICDISIVDNNNTWKDMEEVVDRIDYLDLEPVISHCNGDMVSLEKHTNLSTGESSIDPPDTIELLGNTNCVFCDIEQAKSSLTNICTQSIVLQKEDQRSCISIDSSADKELDNRLEDTLHLGNSLELSNELSLNHEESVQIKDPLKVIKKEISKDCEETKTPEAGDIKISEESAQSSCPSIEVRESTPTLSTTDVADQEDKEEEFDIEAKRRNFRRCSSLKCGKTPPGTPGRKKIVRFADVFGLDLVDVKTFLDEVPTVPKSAYSDLHLLPDTDSSFAPSTTSFTVTAVTPQAHKVLVPLFQQPFLTPNFMDRVMSNNVCLESAAVSDMSLFAITGVVRVKNIDFHKSVLIRYSINGWRNYSDLQARYVPNSCDGFSDKFSFILYAHTLSVGQKLEFCVRYHTGGAQFWDSNAGLNYKFECIQQPVPQTHNNHMVPPSPVDTWAAFL